MYVVKGRNYTGTAPCFCCGKVVGIDERRIQWTGTGADILLHVPCALGFVSGLAHDLCVAENQPLTQLPTFGPGEGVEYLLAMAAKAREERAGLKQP